MIMLGQNKQNITDGLVESIVGGEKEYSTKPQQHSEAAKLCALEVMKAIETKSPEKLIASLSALLHEIEGEEEEPELEIEL